MTKTPEPECKIHAVLDRSALQSYAQGHVHVGEIVREIGDEDGLGIGIPAAALAEAHASYLGDDHARILLHMLTTLPETTVLNLDRDTARSMAGFVPHTNGDLSRAHAVWAANKYHALYFTTEPATVKSVVPDRNVLAIPAEDA
jgi:hypothetical protein